MNWKPKKTNLIKWGEIVRTDKIKRDYLLKWPIWIRNFKVFGILQRPKLIHMLQQQENSMEKTRTDLIQGMIQSFKTRRGMLTRKSIQILRKRGGNMPKTRRRKRLKIFRKTADYLGGIPRRIQRISRQQKWPSQRKGLWAGTRFMVLWTQVRL